SGPRTRRARAIAASQKACASWESSIATKARTLWVAPNDSIADLSWRDERCSPASAELPSPLYFFKDFGSGVPVANMSERELQSVGITRRAIPKQGIGISWHQRHGRHHDSVARAFEFAHGVEVLEGDQAIGSGGDDANPRRVFRQSHLSLAIRRNDDL